MQYSMIMATLALSVYAAPAPMITGAPSLSRRQEGGAAGGSSVLDAPMTIAAGESFDGGNAVFDRGVSCTGQAEGGDSDAVFILEKGATLSNVRIGPNQIEGVHCNGGCTLNNVVWDAVCEDAFSIKKQEDGETTTINGGGAKGADDKVIQHNGGGTVIIKDFEVSDFGKLYRSCGNCKSMPARHVEISGGSATNGKMLVGINPNMGDTAKISGIQVTGVSKQCITFEGVTDGSEPKEVGTCDGAGSNSGSGGSSEAPATPTTPAGGSESPAASEVADPVQSSVDGGSGDDNESDDNQSGDDSNNDDSNDENKDEDKEDKEQDSGSSNNDEQDLGNENQDGSKQPSQPPQFGAPPQFGGRPQFGGFQK